MKTILLSLLLQTPTCKQIQKLIQNGSKSWVNQNYERIKKLCPEAAIHIPQGFPIRNLANSYFTSDIGLRYHPINKTMRHHNGIDIATSDTIIATASGIIEKVDYSPTLGKYIIIDHKNGFKTKYGHLHKVLVYKGMSVVLGSPIGISGSTGLSTGRHVHYEVLKRG
ncbi:MAG: M23 family metallopeptidase, partial [Bacteroidota bacterium]